MKYPQQYPTKVILEPLLNTFTVVINLITVFPSRQNSNFVENLRAIASQLATAPSTTIPPTAEPHSSIENTTGLHPFAKYLCSTED